MSNWREVTVLANLAAQPRFNGLEYEEAIAEAQKLLDATKRLLSLDDQTTAIDSTSDSPAESIDAVGATDSTDQLSNSKIPVTLAKNYPKLFPVDYDQLLRGIITSNNTSERHAKFLKYLNGEACHAFVLESGVPLPTAMDDQQGYHAWGRKLVEIYRDPGLMRIIDMNAKTMEATYKKGRYTEEEFLRIRGEFMRFTKGQKELTWRINGMKRHKK